jgi:D-proline dehydrogenase
MRVAVVGGGITGLFAALSLERSGAAVTLYDGEAPGARSVHAAGIIEATTAYQTNTISFLRRVVRLWRRRTCVFRSVDGRWLLESLRTLERAPPGPWEATLDRMGRDSLATYAALAREKDDFGFVPGGLLERYEDASHYAEAKQEALAHRATVPVDVRDDGRGAGDLFFPEVAWLDTRPCVARLLRELRTTTFVRSSVTAVDPAGRLATPDGSVEYDTVVACTGVTSRSLGVPLTAVRGYGWRVRPARNVELATIHVDRGIALVPLGRELKATGGWDFDLQGRPRRVAEVLAAIRKVIEIESVLEVSDGVRPCTPDGLPTAGRRDRLVVANGGFRLGWSFAPALGEAAARLALGTAENDPFLARFCGSLHGDAFAGRGINTALESGGP